MFWLWKQVGQMWGAGVGVGVAAEAVSTGVGAAGVSVGLAGAAFGYIRNRTVFQN